MTQNIPPTPLFDTLAELHAIPKTIPPVAQMYPQDFQFALQFLHSYRGSEATFNSYRREVERLLQWTWKIAKKSLRDLKREDIESFIGFCQCPPLSWIGAKNVARFIENQGQRLANTEWRPFVITDAEKKAYALSQKALQAIFSVLSSFFNYLLQEDYVERNPVAQIRQKSKFMRKTQHQTVVRRLSELQWSYVIETAEQMANKDPSYERTLFMMNALFGMYLRISELSASLRWSPQMGDFHQDYEGNWWFKTVGKGNKERIIAVSDSMLSALKRYRLSQNLTPLPTRGETTPLLLRHVGKGPITSTRQIRALVQECFDRAFERIKADGFIEEADQLRAATVHWLRHTGISEDVKHRPREHVRDDAGHGSSAITDRYIDVELHARHASSRHKKIKPD